MDPIRHLRFSVASLVLIITLGTIGYSLIEGWKAFDALYMTVITLATVGFKEVQPLSPEGKLFTIVLIISGQGDDSHIEGVERFPALNQAIANGTEGDN